MIEYGSTFTATLASNTSASDIKSVVLNDPGTTTHSSNMATRTNLLEWSSAGGQSLTVTAPANSFMATPGTQQTDCWKDLVLKRHECCCFTEDEYLSQRHKVMTRLISCLSITVAYLLLLLLLPMPELALLLLPALLIMMLLLLLLLRLLLLVSGGQR